mgnify:CR=1 FL=1
MANVLWDFMCRNESLSQFSLWYLVLQIEILKCYGTYLILLKSQLQYSTEIEKRKENRLIALGQLFDSTTKIPENIGH